MAGDGPLAAPRLARGCRVFAVCQRDRVAAFGWVSTGQEWIGELRLHLAPGQGEAYLWNCFTLLEHRRRGMFYSLLVHAAQRLQAEGLMRLWIAEGGGPAVPALPAAGYRPVAAVEERQAGRFRRLRLRAAEAAPRRSLDALRTALGLGREPHFGRIPPKRRH